jgi:antitoxin HicB
LDSSIAGLVSKKQFLAHGHFCPILKTPSPAKRGQRLVPVPWWLAPKLALYLAMRAQGIHNAALARRLNVDERVVRRMLDPAHETKAEKIQAALAALGKRLTMEVEDAA